jgi:hypothetical protein
MASKKALAVLALGGLALAGYAAAASSGSLPDDVDLGLGANAKCAAGPPGADERAVEARVELCARHGKPMGMPAFREDNGTVQGKWVGFGVDSAAGTLTGFTSRGPMADAVVFRSVALGGSLQEEMARGGWAAQAGGLRVLALDAPNAFLAIANTGNDTRTVTFTVADGIAVADLPDAVSGPNATGVVLSAGGHQAALRLARGATDTVQGQVVTVTLPKDGAAVFHVRGFPRLLEQELRGVHHAAHERHGRGPPGPPPPPPGGEAQSDAEESAPEA